MKCIYLLLSREVVGSGGLAERQDRCARLSRPGHTSVLPVLIHVNGVTGAVADSDLLARVIDFSEAATVD